MKKRMIDFAKRVAERIMKAMVIPMNGSVVTSAGRPVSFVGCEYLYGTPWCGGMRGCYGF